MWQIRNSAASASSAVNPSPQTQAVTKKEKKRKKIHVPNHLIHKHMRYEVNNAIKGLDEHGSSSLQAIKKIIAANYKSTRRK